MLFKFPPADGSKKQQALKHQCQMTFVRVHMKSELSACFFFISLFYADASYNKRSLWNRKKLNSEMMEIFIVINYRWLWSRTYNSPKMQYGQPPGRLPFCLVLVMYCNLMEVTQTESQFCPAAQAVSLIRGKCFLVDSCRHITVM